MNWHFEIVEPDLNEWRELAESGEHAHVFFHPVLVEAWLATYRPLHHMEPFMVRAVAGTNVSLLPMVVWYRNWKNAFLRMIVSSGFSDFDYHDPLFKYKPTKEELVAYWRGLIDYLKTSFDYDSIIIDGITNNIADGLDFECDEICPQLHLGDIHSESDLMAFFKTSLRGDIRRQIRRLEDMAPLSYKEYRFWEEVPTKTFAEFMRQHSQRWPNAYKAPHFHENLLRYGLKLGLVHFSTLSVGDTEIAWHLGFSFRGRYYYYMPAGNQEYSRFSPTKIHLFYLVRRAVEQCYDIYDHLRGEENYKSGWSNDSQYVNSFNLKSTDIISRMKRNILAIKGLIS